MAVWAVVEMDVDWCVTGDEYFLRFTARDGSEIAISMAGALFDAHGPAIHAARRRRAVARCPLKPVPGGKA